MQQEVTPICDFGVWFQEALNKLRLEGPGKMMRQDAASQIMRNERHHRSAGKLWEQKVGWGDRYPRIDYTAQELCIGNLYLLRIDMGYEIPLGVHLRTALGEPDKLEKNQCVCVHMALGIEWITQGRPRRIPDKNMVMIVASQVRSAEYQQSQEFMTRCSQPRSESSAKLFSLAHDVMTASHDRNFQDIHLFLDGLDMGMHRQVVRIFDLEWRGNHTTINVHQFGDMDQQIGLDMSINLIVWRGHMRFLLPSADTRPTSWRDWQKKVSSVIIHDWAPWHQVLAEDTEQPRLIPLRPCSTCFKLCRFALPGLDSNKPATYSRPTFTDWI